jgi:hypothetical protein
LGYLQSKSSWTAAGSAAPRRFRPHDTDGKFNASRPPESGVAAPTLPPHSKTLRAQPRAGGNVRDRKGEIVSRGAGRRRSAAFTPLNPKGIVASSPRLACNAYLGFTFRNGNNRNAVVANPVCGLKLNGRNRVAVGNSLRTLTQGSSCRATLGFGPKSLWDSLCHCTSALKQKSASLLTRLLNFSGKAALLRRPNLADRQVSPTTF